VLVAAALVLSTGNVAASVAKWSVVSSPNVAGADNWLRAVSCTTSTFCMAVGGVLPPSADEAPLSEAWNGKTVRLLSMPNPLAGAEGDADLSSVSCTSPTFCMAVGDYNSNSAGVGGGLIEQWNGTTWAMTTPLPQGFLDGVSCVSTTFCFAVGWSAASTAEIMQWNGLSWIQVANPAPTPFSSLGSVKCTSIDFCMAIGGIVEEWNGAVWTLDAMQSVIPDDFLACPTSTFCMATDTLSGIVQWNGSVWSVSTAGTSGQDIGAISCLTPTSCMAVGDVEIANGVYRTFVEQWNGANWTVMTSANSPRTNNGLLGVKCTSATFCMAVGYHDSSTTQDTLVEKY
jgi:hypothetical protein